MAAMSRQLRFPAYFLLRAISASRGTWYAPVPCRRIWQLSLPVGS